jgi:hypothetical protein
MNIRKRQCKRMGNRVGRILYKNHLLKALMHEIETTGAAVLNVGIKLQGTFRAATFLRQHVAGRTSIKMSLIPELVTTIHQMFPKHQRSVIALALARAFGFPNWRGALCASRYQWDDTEVTIDKINVAEFMLAFVKQLKPALLNVNQRMRYLLSPNGKLPLYTNLWTSVGGS